MAHLKITFLNYFFDRVSPLLALKGSKKHLLSAAISLKTFRFCIHTQPTHPPTPTPTHTPLHAKYIYAEELKNFDFGAKSVLSLFCARTFQGLHSVRLWTPTITLFVKSKSKIITFLLNGRVIVNISTMESRPHLQKEGQYKNIMQECRLWIMRCSRAVVYHFKIMFQSY
jgi:hypothetical protein